MLLLYEWHVSYDARNIILFVLVEFFEKKNIKEKEIKRRNILLVAFFFSHVANAKDKFFEKKTNYQQKEGKEKA